MKPKVYITRRIPQAALDIIAGSCRYDVYASDDPIPRERLLQEAADAEGLLVLLTDVIDEEVFRSAPRLKIVANMAVGYDNIDVEAATRHGVMVTNTPGVLTETTADLAFALLLATARQLPQAERALRQGRWQTWRPMEFTGLDVYGTTLGIIGMGRIGAAVARRAGGFGMRVIYYNRRPNPELEAALGAQYRPLDDLLRESDFISIHCPLTPETRHLLSRREFALMKPTAVVINTARGPIIDEEALYEALQSGQIWAAGLDVFSREPVDPQHPLLSLERVVTLPHIGSASVATRTRMAVLAAQNLVAGVCGRRPPSLVNPQVLG